MTREDVLRHYRRWIVTPDGFVALEKLQQRFEANNGRLTLGCFCAPDACHGHILREKLMEAAGVPDDKPKRREGEEVEQ